MYFWELQKHHLTNKFRAFQDMFNIHSFMFNPFQENTFVLDNGEEAIIVDPGCFNKEEQGLLQQHLSDNGLKPVLLVLTHGHIDHILGNAWVFNEYGLLPAIHEKDLVVLQSGTQTAQLYNIPYEPSPTPERFLKAGERIGLGDDELEVLFVPGHAPGHIALYCKAQGFVIGGDVLFQRSIGRTDLPGGNLETLLTSIRQQLFTLPDETVVYCGHGPSTTVGEEKQENPFLI